MIELPHFRPNANSRARIKQEANTARFIRALWNAAEQRRKDAKFISLLVRCGWVNIGREATRKWRNRNIANYLQVKYESDEQLSRELSRAFPRLKHATALLKMHTGITHYRNPYRPKTLEFVELHARQIAKVFGQLSSTVAKKEVDIRRAAKMVTDLGFIEASDKKVNPLNGLTPVLACLDPSHAFPILNDKTNRLLGVIGKKRDADGAVALFHLIGSKGIRDSFHLDVYADTADFSKSTKQRAPAITGTKPPLPASEFRSVGQKPEIDSFAQIAGSRRRIRKLHNLLTNRFCKYLMWQYRFEESQFDVLIRDWRPGRKLLIEAKTASAGVGGRVQVRQAIGQLFDYRHRFFKNDTGHCDLAILLPSEPSSDIRALLETLNIHVIWFEGKKLKGSIEF